MPQLLIATAEENILKMQAQKIIKTKSRETSMNEFVVNHA